MYQMRMYHRTINYVLRRHIHGLQASNEHEYIIGELMMKNIDEAGDRKKQKFVTLETEGRELKK